MFNKLFNKIFNKEVILYLIFGVLTTIIDLIVFYIANNILNIHYVISTCLAWIFAVLFAYVTNKIFVFSSQKKSKSIFKEMLYFFSLRLISLLMSIIFMFVMIDIINISSVISKILVNILVVISNYFFSKLYIFKA